MVKPGAAVLDVGITRHRPVWWAMWHRMSRRSPAMWLRCRAVWAPMTRAMLLVNVVEMAESTIR